MAAHAGVVEPFLPTALLVDQVERLNALAREHGACVCDSCMDWYMAGVELKSRARAAAWLADPTGPLPAGIVVAAHDEPATRELLTGQYLPIAARAAEADALEAEWRALTPAGWAFVNAVTADDSWAGGSADLLAAAEAVAAPAD